MTVADEYRATNYVFVGKVQSEHKLGLDKDGFFAATAYRVAVVSSYKGKPPKALTIYNSNTSARFDMDVGKSYVLFVYHGRRQNIVSNCGWSDEISQSNRVLRELNHRDDFAKRPFHCWRGTNQGCVPDLRTYRAGEKPGMP